MNEQIPENNQWKLNGDCKKCRRKEYCSKPCGAKKKRDKRIMRSIAFSIIDATAPSQSIADQAKKWY